MNYLCAKTHCMNHLRLGDNLEVLKRLDSESVDLIYLDPPFFSNRNYEVIWGDAGEIRSFQDRWAGGISHYIDWLKDRVREMYRILKPTGSLFLHCDWHANAYIRVEIMDKLFGYDQFRGEIMWQRHNAHNDAKKKLAVLKDSIWYYSKSNQFCYNPVYSEHSESYKTDFYKTDDKDGKGVYQLADMSAPAGGGMSAINKITGKPNGWYVYKGFEPPERGWRYSLETMQKLDSEGRIFFPKLSNGHYDFTKRLRLKRYLLEQKGNLMGDIWTDIQNIQSQMKERIGYPTQKPEKLLERIIEMASNEGDVVLDPFVGGGTTVAVADRLKRRWIGIDQSVQAVKVTEMRLIQQRDLFSQPFETQLLKYDFDTLRYQDAFEFEQFIITQFGGTPNVRQRGDLGIDGKAMDHTPIQVKRSDGIGRNVVDNFQSAITRYDKRCYEKNKSEARPIGYLIAFSFGKGAIEEVARLKNVENVIIQLVKVSEIVPMAQRPKLQITHTVVNSDKKGMSNVQINATAQSDCAIQFYSWDLDYKANIGFRPSILLDKKGEQTLALKAGQHAIAVKVVNDDGLEAIEILRLTL
jgi:DNA modification methylase